jgi:hypothetical protein
MRGLCAQKVERRRRLAADSAGVTVVSNGQAADGCIQTWIGSVDQFGGACTAAVLAAIPLGHGDVSDSSGSHRNVTPYNREKGAEVELATAWSCRPAAAGSMTGPGVSLLFLAELMPGTPGRLRWRLLGRTTATWFTAGNNPKIGPVFAGGTKKTIWG